MGEVLRIIGEAIGELRNEFKLLSSESDFLAIDGGGSTTNYEEAVTLDGGNA